MRSVVLIPKEAAEEAKENPKVAELKERLINAYPRLFSGVANKNPADCGRFGTARIKLKPNPKIYRHREYQLQGDRAEAMKKLLAEFIERSWIGAGLPPVAGGQGASGRPQPEVRGFVVHSAAAGARGVQGPGMESVHPQVPKKPQAGGGLE